MTESRDIPKRTLGHLKRLSRDGRTLLHERPLDELAHAKWLDRAKRYLDRKMPEVQVLPPDQLIPVRMPNFLSPSYKQPHPLDAAMSRFEQRQKLIQKMLGIIASAIEMLELRMEPKTLIAEQAVGGDSVKAADGLH